jgi:hypothetical protein
MRMSPLIFVVAALACTRPDPWAPCRALGPIGFSASPASCDEPACRACVAALTDAWGRRADRAAADAFRVRFMSVAAGAREAFAVAAHPDGTYPYEHCTAGVAPSSRCAALSPYCVGVIRDGLVEGRTSLAARGSLVRAATGACPAARAAMVERLTACAPIAAGDPCDGGACAACVAGRLAASSVLAPEADAPEGDAAFDAMVNATPEPVSRAVAEALGAPDAPADLETVVVQRALRRYCFALVARSAAPPPYACNGVMVRFLTHADYGDSGRAWEALGVATAAVRGSALDALLLEAARAPTIDAAVMGRLRALPAEGTLDALQRGLRGAAVTDGAYADLRRELERRGVTAAALPPVNRPSTPLPPVTEAAPLRPAVPAVRQGSSAPSREG